MKLGWSEVAVKSLVWLTTNSNIMLTTSFQSNIDAGNRNSQSDSSGSIKYWLDELLWKLQEVDQSSLRDTIFASNEASTIGSRLGIDFMRAQSECFVVSVFDKKLSLQQSHMGMLGISGVVWDCGLLMIDFLCSYFGCQSAAGGSACQQYHLLTNVLDLGCGTGVCGLAALAANAAKNVMFSDCVVSGVLNDNMTDIMSDGMSSSCSVVRHDWASPELPPELLYGSACSVSSSSSSLCATDSELFVWDAIICSDVLYEHKSHAALMSLLRKLPFKCLFLSYKKRHEEYEHVFLEELLTWCHVYVVDVPALSHRQNITKESQLSGLYMMVVTRKEER